MSGFSARTSISIGILIAGAMVFNYVITSENIPASLSALLGTLDLSPLVFIVAAQIVLMLLGTAQAQVTAAFLVR